MLKYIELKMGQGVSGPAWVARVSASKSGRTLHFGGKTLKRAHLPSANHYDTASGDPYWVSAITKDGFNRRWEGAAKVRIEAGAVEEYLRVTASAELDLARFEVIEDFPTTDTAQKTSL